MAFEDSLRSLRYGPGVAKQEYDEVASYDRPSYGYTGGQAGTISRGRNSPTIVPPRLSRRLPPSPEWSPTPSTDENASETIHSNIQQQPSYIGYIKSPMDAVLLLAACDMPCSTPSERSTKIPRRISRRLLDDERASLIRSGSIFVWDEREASMRRWTDGRCWSASRVSGCFLTYRELEMRKKTSNDSSKDGPMQNLYKSDGLIKQSFSITTASNRKLHVISYYRKQDVRMGLLQRVSEDPRLRTNGPGSWGVHVDEKEYGELLNREDEALPESVTVCQSGELPLTPVEEYRGVKRLSSECENNESLSNSVVSPMNKMPRYPLLPSHYEREVESRVAYPSPYVHNDDAMTKGYRYDQPSAYMHYRGAGYGPMALYPTAGLMPSNVPRGPMSNRNAPLSTSMSNACSMTRPYVPLPSNLPPYSPRRSDMEQDSIEALMSLRSNSAPGTSYQPSVPLLSRDVMSSNPNRSRPAPVSAPDRDALQKLSVRV